MEIKAFKAYRFNPDVVGEAGKCIAPPYDVINTAQQQQLYQRSPYNIVRIIKGKTEAGDNETKSQYTRAADCLKNWLAKNVLKQDDKETIYAYVQDFEAAGKNYRRSGFIALGRLVEYGLGVRPHENTLDSPKTDRLKLTQATAAQFGQIFMLYDDAEKTADKIVEKAVAAKKPVIDFTDEDKIRHQMFAIDDAKDISAIVRMMENKETVIADGHHRYETALNYRRLTKKTGAEMQINGIINTQNEGLVILPIHRLVGNLQSFDIGRLVEKLQSEFKVTEFTYGSDDSKQKAKGLMFKRMQRAFEQGKNAFGSYDGRSFYFILLKNKKALESLNMNDALKSLDVVVLHKLILEGILGIGEQQLAGETNIEYIKDIGTAIDEAIAAVDKGQKQVVFFMNPTRVEQVKQVAATNKKMPQKSTFFYPKIFSGLTINKL
jgi:uncharacterized protein (DUF1015 family)